MECRAAKVTATSELIVFFLVFVCTLCSLGLFLWFYGSRAVVDAGFCQPSSALSLNDSANRFHVAVFLFRTDSPECLPKLLSIVVKFERFELYALLELYELY